jgi:UDP-2,3-diacylglucosamine hydrolase
LNGNVRRDLLISDLHLSQERPSTTQRFLDFLAREAPGARGLYVLGDLFDYWLGDDELSAPGGEPFARRVADAILNLVRRGTPVHVMQGNRDFLLGDAFLSACGARALPDPTVSELGGVRTLLMHGDTLCTDDLDYLAWRRTARSPSWQADFLAAPIAERRARSRALRAESEARKRGKSATIMDVNRDAVAEAFDRHRVARLIHGHTHRPGRHELELEGRLCERWVLPDWYRAGGYLVAEDGEARLVSLAPPAR